MKAEGFYTAQICNSGHIVNDHIADVKNVHNAFCPECGAPSIVACHDCGQEIQGEMQDPFGVGGIPEYSRPLFCPNCGKPYPWTQAGLDAARELIDLETSLPPPEKEDAINDIRDIVAQTSRSPVAETKIKLLISKVGKEFGNAMKEILIKLITEAAKRKLWPSLFLCSIPSLYPFCG